MTKNHQDFDPKRAQKIDQKTSPILIEKSCQSGQEFEPEKRGEMKQKLVPVDQQKMTRGRAPSGMPKLAKNPQLKKPAKKPVKRKAVTRKSVEEKPKKKLPPMRQPADLSRQAKEQPRDRSGKFVPVDQRSFFGKCWSLVNGDMNRHIQECAEENERGKQLSLRATKKGRR